MFIQFVARLVYLWYAVGELNDQQNGIAHADL